MQLTEVTLDNAALARLKADVGEKTAEILLQSLRQEVDETVRDIFAGVADNDWDMVETKAHALKSAAATFGARRLSLVCREIEMAAKSGTEGAVTDKLISEFRSVVTATCTAFGWAVAAA